RLLGSADQGSYMQHPSGAHTSDGKCDTTAHVQIAWRFATFYALLHFVAGAGMLWFEPTFKGLLLCFVTYVVRMFAISAGYHRYFSHRSFSTNRWLQLGLALWAMTAA